MGSNGLDPTDPMDGRGLYRGVRLVYVSVPSLGPMSTILFDLLCLWRARRGFDVVYMLGYGASLFCFIPRLFGSNVWINMDGLEWTRSKWSWPGRVWLKVMEGIAMWTPNCIIADADAMQANLAARHSHMPRCEVIPYGAQVVEQPPSVDLLAEWGLEPSGYYLVVCRLEPENHVLEVLRGYTASDSAAPLIILGDHRVTNAYVTQLLAVKDERVRFVGTVYDQDKLRALRYYSRAYFHGHSVGGTNPSLLESLGCGNVVIAHDNVFNREVAGDAACYFASADAIPALVAQIEADEPRVAAMRSRAREIAAGRYTWKKVTEHYLRLLRE